MFTSIKFWHHELNEIELEFCKAVASDALHFPLSKRNELLTSSKGLNI